MKLPLLFRLGVVLLILITAACRSNNGSEAGVADAAEKTVTSPTIIYLVRHAEKDISDPNNEDPDLTPVGEARAEALRDLLDGQEVDALYATKYVRTKNTLRPLADARQLEVRQYEAHDFNNLKEQVLQQHRGGTLVIAGHSNTVLPIIEAFGAKRPVPDISDNTYDYIFKLTVPVKGTAVVEANQFGTASR